MKATLNQQMSRTKSTMLQLIDRQKVHPEGTTLWTILDQQIKACQMKMLLLSKKMRAAQRNSK
jgi:hypothetical protein